MKTLPVIIAQHGSWYTFSTHAHKYFNSADQVTVHGIKNLILALQATNCIAQEVWGYNINNKLQTAKNINSLLDKIQGGKSWT